ncbi:universal stress protein [Legionella geestiana]|uniref:universal stress protein n=1 Tax=Legionella geestiana TaxID=45065 RepID=UPI0010919ADA|nr:universal stress protein [Legionella geestiana]QDQ38960.1 universal stress protein [Legionella geestiana]
MYKRILHATDLSRDHYALCEQAALLARQLNAELYLMHVVALPASLQLAQGLGFAELATPSTSDAKTVLSVLGENFGVPVSRQFADIGAVTAHVFDKIRELNIDLLVIGSHTPGGFANFLGSNAQSLVNHAPCDVLTLRVGEEHAAS